MRRVPMQLSASAAWGRGRVPPVRGFIRRWQGSDQRLARFDSAGTYSTKREAPQAIDDAYGRRERVDTLGDYFKRWPQLHPHAARTQATNEHRRLGPHAGSRWKDRT